MARYIACLAVTLLAGAPLCAGELDREFATKASPAPAVQKNAAALTTAAAVVPKSSELDKEAPADAGRGGWHGGAGHGGWGRGWGGGWGRGWGGGWGRGWGGGWGRGWSVGWRGGWGGWGGWRGGWGGWGWGGYWPGISFAYYPTYYYPNYVAYGYSYPAWNYCW